MVIHEAMSFGLPVISTYEGCIPDIIDDNVKIRVLDADSGHILRDVHVESNTFNIVANIEVIEPPEAGVIWRDGQTRVIRWKMIGHNAFVSTVDIQYSTDDDTNPATFDDPQDIVRAARLTPRTGAHHQRGFVVLELLVILYALSKLDELRDRGKGSRMRQRR